MRFLLPREQRLHRVQEEEGDLSRRLFRKVLRARLLAVGCAAFLLGAVIVGLAGMFWANDRNVWFVPVSGAMFLVGGVLFVACRKDSSDLEFMRDSLAEYRAFLGKEKGK